MKEINPGIVIRKSVAVFVTKIILLDFIFEFVYLSWRSISHFLPLPSEALITLNIFSIIFFVIFISLIQTVLLVYISLKWVNEYYEIRKEDIAQVTGILSKTEKSYPYRDIQSVTIHQGILGRLFNYGSVHLYIPTLGYDLSFNEVTKPGEFVDQIKKANPNIKSGSYIFRR
jgi:uncharacterized membrane protein YdbT with pleckstrin-like domain